MMPGILCVSRFLPTSRLLLDRDTCMGSVFNTLERFQLLLCRAQTRLHCPPALGRGKVSVFAMLLALLWSAVALLALTPLPVQAATTDVTLEDLGVEDTIFLPTVRSQRKMMFTRPSTWNVSGSSYVEVHFQHSIQLLPGRSWLEIIVNDKALKKIDLNPGNAAGTTVRVPLPPGYLEDTNHMAFRVEQHYTDVCEDPTEPSLWTQILPDSKIVFNYNETLPKLELTDLPYPIVDPLSYIPQTIHYVAPANASAQALQALAYVNVFFAQTSQGKGLATSVSTSGKPKASTKDEHIVFVGTPSQLSGLKAYQGIISRSGLTLSGGQWSNVSGDDGVLLVFRNPAQPNKGILIVSGNTDAGVMQAARFLTTRPPEDTLQGMAMKVPSQWAPPSRQSVLPKRYIETESLSFVDLGIATTMVEKITAPPIVYHIPIVGDFSDPNTKLFWDIDLSYGPELNPLFSSLELRFNDKPIANVPLQDKENGEEHKPFTVRIPNELIRTGNTLVAQFHLMPEKYGWCVDKFEDNAWAKIHDTSGFRVEGFVKPNLPNLNGLDDGLGYPYTRSQNLSNTHIHLAMDNPTQSDIETLVAISTRLGRFTLADTDLRFTVGKGGDNFERNKDVLLISRGDTHGMDGNFRLLWDKGTPTEKRFRLNNSMVYRFSDVESKTVPSLEQHYGGDTVVTLLSGTTDHAQSTLANFLETDSSFQQIDGTILNQYTARADALQNVSDPVIFSEAQANSPVSWFSNIPWFWIIVAVVVVLILLFLILPLIVRLVKRK